MIDPIFDGVVVPTAATIITLSFGSGRVPDSSIKIVISFINLLNNFSKLSQARRRRWPALFLPARPLLLFWVPANP